MSEELPKIYKHTSKISSCGNFKEVKEITVADNDIDKAKKIFDKLWKEGN